MKVIDRTENILQNIPSTRSSDRLLLLKYWRQQGLVLNEYQTQRFLQCTAAESITRARRELKAQYPASDKVDNERFTKFVEYKNSGAVSWLHEKD